MIVRGSQSMSVTFTEPKAVREGPPKLANKHAKRNSKRPRPKVTPERRSDSSPIKSRIDRCVAKSMEILPWRDPPTPEKRNHRLAPSSRNKSAVEPPAPETTGKRPATPGQPTLDRKNDDIAHDPILEFRKTELSNPPTTGSRRSPSRSRERNKPLPQSLLLQQQQIKIERRQNRNEQLQLQKQRLRHWRGEKNVKQCNNMPLTTKPSHEKKNMDTHNETTPVMIEENTSSDSLLFPQQQLQLEHIQKHLEQLRQQKERLQHWQAQGENLKQSTSMCSQEDDRVVLHHRGASVGAANTRSKSLPLPKQQLQKIEKLQKHLDQLQLQKERLLHQVQEKKKTKQSTSIAPKCTQKDNNSNSKEIPQQGSFLSLNEELHSISIPTMASQEDYSMVETHQGSFQGFQDRVTELLSMNLATVSSTGAESTSIEVPRQASFRTVSSTGAESTSMEVPRQVSFRDARNEELCAQKKSDNGWAAAVDESTDFGFQAAVADPSSVDECNHLGFHAWKLVIGLQSFAGHFLSRSWATVEAAWQEHEQARRQSLLERAKQMTMPKRPLLERAKQMAMPKPPTTIAASGTERTPSKAKTRLPSKNECSRPVMENSQLMKLRFEAEEGGLFFKVSAFCGATALILTTSYGLILDPTGNAWTIGQIVLSLFVYAIALLSLVLEGLFPNTCGIRVHLRMAITRKTNIFRFVWGRGVLCILAGGSSCLLNLTPSTIAGIFMAVVGISAVVSGAVASGMFYLQKGMTPRLADDASLPNCDFDESHDEEEGSAYRCMA